MYVCQECHDKDKIWTGCPFGYNGHIAWSYTPCSICGKHPATAMADCKYYNDHKEEKMNKEASV
jgi:hypothetical protein